METKGNPGVNPMFYLYGAGVLIALVLGLTIIFQAKKGLTNLFGDDSKERQGQADKIIINPKLMKLTEKQARLIATALYTAMKGKSGIKDYALIPELFKRIKTSEDMKAVYKYFGIKDKEDLIQWIKGEKLPASYRQLIDVKLSLLKKTI